MIRFKKKKKSNKELAEKPVRGEGNIFEREIEIGEAKVMLRNTARINREYKIQTDRDYIKDFSEIQAAFYNCIQSFKEKEMSDYELGIMLLDSIDEVKLQDITYCMAKLADPNIEEDIEVWLDQFQGTDFVAAMNKIIRFVTATHNTTSVP